MVNILAFAGSTRHASFNQQLLDIAVAGALAAGAQVTAINLRDYPLPIYNQDLEATEGIPENALALKQLMMTHQGLLIASPEYNGFPSALLKNTLDWISRPQASDVQPLVAFQGKVAALMAASPGGGGGTRGLVCLRMLMQNLGVLALPQQITVPAAMKAFDAQGQLIDAHAQTAALGLGATLTDTLTRLARHDG